MNLIPAEGEGEHINTTVFAINGPGVTRGNVQFSKGWFQDVVAISINKMRSQISLIYFAQNASFICEVVTIRGYD